MSKLSTEEVERRLVRTFTTRADDLKEAEPAAHTGGSVPLRLAGADRPPRRPVVPLGVAAGTVLIVGILAIRALSGSGGDDEAGTVVTGDESQADPAGEDPLDPPAGGLVVVPGETSEGDWGSWDGNNPGSFVDPDRTCGTEDASAPPDWEGDPAGISITWSNDPSSALPGLGNNEERVDIGGHDGVYGELSSGFDDDAEATSNYAGIYFEDGFLGLMATCVPRDELLAYAATVEREPDRPEFGMAPPPGFELGPEPEDRTSETTECDDGGEEGLDAEDLVEARCVIIPLD